MTNLHILSGSCLCDSIRFEIIGSMRDVIFCHCTQCRKSSGHFVAATAVDNKDFRLLQDNSLEWYKSSEEAERGFCNLCGSSLFWRSFKESNIFIMAGSINGPTELKGREHIFMSSIGDYYSIEDGLPQFDYYPPDQKE
tara:strand:- start:77 stop:493 length:417 start_codon:yes stop_codon:yes gene_type:complete